jgi:hypothetical protein
MGKAAFVSESRFAFVSIHSMAPNTSSSDTVAKLVPDRVISTFRFRDRKRAPATDKLPTRLDRWFGANLTA